MLRLPFCCCRHHWFWKRLSWCSAVSYSSRPPFSALCATSSIQHDHSNFPSLDLYKRGAGRGSDIPCDLAGDPALSASHSYWANLQVTDVSTSKSVCDKSFPLLSVFSSYRSNCTRASKCIENHKRGWEDGSDGKGVPRKDLSSIHSIHLRSWEWWRISVTPGLER